MKSFQTTADYAENLYIEIKDKKGYLGFYQTVIKRIFDIVLCLLAFPLFLLILIVVGVLIKIDDNGPIFYHSARIGKDLKDYKMLKFRTMKVNSPDIRNVDGSTYNSISDQRVTRIGRFLRESSIDEVPQIINVLIGQMSIVGPRACDIESKNLFSPDEKDKFLVRPGITGYTQAYYRNNLSVREKRLFDSWYAHKVSFLLDVKILFKTVKTVLIRENIYTND